MQNIGQLIEELCVANIKLYNVCNQKANCDNLNEKQLKILCKKDIELCKKRAFLKNAIDKAINNAIINNELSVIDEVKDY